MSTIEATEATQGRVIRYETRLQRAKRDEFIRTQLPSPIKSLPNELLCQILKTTIETTPAQCDPHRVRKHELETVCRHWRDIIVNTPSFWTFVQLAPTWPKALVKVHLERSRQCPLDLVFSGFQPRFESTTLLDIVMPTTHRWRSLTILLQSPNDTLLILKRFDCAMFPSLALLSVPIRYYSKFLHPGNVPVLRSLEIRNDSPSPDGFQLLPTVEKLSIDIAFFRSYPIRWLQSSSLQGLKVLSLKGNTTYWQMQPNSIHLPRLAHFSCEVTHARELLQGLAAPNLTHVNYIRSHYESLSVALQRIQSKWTSVRELIFGFTQIACCRAYIPRALYLAAPNLRGLEVMQQDLGSLLQSEDGLRRIDRWEHLERFVIISDVRKVEDMRRRLVPWLKKRMKFGKPALKVFFSFANPHEVKLERSALDEIGKYCSEVNFCMQEKIGHTS